MGTRGQDKKHHIKVSWGRESQEVEVRSAARLRLMSWGAVIRRYIVLQGPSANTYHQQPFLKERVSMDTVYDMNNNQQVLNRAIEVDGWLDPIKETNSSAYTAVAIKYVQRGHSGRTLPYKEQVRRFTTETKLGQASYYLKLEQVHRYIEGILIKLHE